MQQCANCVHNSRIYHGKSERLEYQSYINKNLSKKKKYEKGTCKMVVLMGLYIRTLENQMKI